MHVLWHAKVPLRLWVSWKAKSKSEVRCWVMEGVELNYPQISYIRTHFVLPCFYSPSQLKLQKRWTTMSPKVTVWKSAEEYVAKDGECPPILSFLYNDPVSYLNLQGWLHCPSFWFHQPSSLISFQLLPCLCAWFVAYWLCYRPAEWVFQAKWAVQH